MICSDSNYAILCCTTYGEKCATKEWKNPNSKKKPIPNLELVQKAYYLFKDKKNIQFLKVKAHTTNTDKHSIGNYYADKLATDAVL